MNRKLATSLVGLVLSLAAQAKVASISIAELGKMSPLILIGKVSSVERIAGLKVAHVEQATFAKGSSARPLAFLAEPTWTCDIAEAKVGERVLLFLSPVKPTNGVTMFKQDIGGARAACAKRGLTLCWLAHSGRGRIPLSRQGQNWTAEVRSNYSSRRTVNPDLWVPKSVPVRSGRARLGDLLAAALPRAKTARHGRN